jgi:hypothetical protein
MLAFVKEKHGFPKEKLRFSKERPGFAKEKLDFLEKSLDFLRKYLLLLRKSLGFLRKNLDFRKEKLGILGNGVKKCCSDLLFHARPCQESNNSLAFAVKKGITLSHLSLKTSKCESSEQDESKGWQLSRNFAHAH